MIVSLTPMADMAPVPRVEVRLEPLQVVDGGSASVTGSALEGGSASVTGPALDGGNMSTVLIDVPAGTDRVTVWRRCERRAMKVGGGVDRAFGGSLALLDLEAGFDTLSTYELECFDGATRLGRVNLGSTVLPGPADLSMAVVQQPLDPSLCAVVPFTWDSTSQSARVTPGALVTTEGASYATSIAAGPRGGVSGVRLVFAAETREVAAAVWSTVGTEDSPQLPVWLVRSRHPLLPRVFFCDTRELVEESVNLHLGGVQSRFVVPTTEVSRPAPALVISPLSYSDLDAAFASYSARDAAFSTYSAADSAWEFAGASGG